MFDKPARPTYQPRRARERSRAARVARHASLAGAGVLAIAATVGASGVLTSPAPAEAGSTIVDMALSQDGGDQRPSEAATLADRGFVVSRSDQREPLDKLEALRVTKGDAIVRTEDLTDDDPRAVAQQLMGGYGFSSSEWGCLDSLWTTESGWDYTADNPTSSAYGIPQALTESTPGLPSDYTSNPVAQIEWGLGYIRDSYGSPCSAWEFHQANGWY